jgi:hypothetical protein
MEVAVTEGEGEIADEAEVLLEQGLLRRSMPPPGWRAGSA